MIVFKDFDKDEKKVYNKYNCYNMLTTLRNRSFLIE